MPSNHEQWHLSNPSERTARANGRVAQLAASKRPPQEIVGELYEAVFSRPPPEAELKTSVTAFGAKDTTRQTAIEDVLWTLLNSPEFVFNH